MAWALGLSGGAAWGQCPGNCNLVIARANAGTSYTLTAGTVMTIGAGVAYAGTATVAGNGVTVNLNSTGTSYGEIGSNGGLTVNSGTTGTIINNLGQVNSQNVYLNAATTINNGSSDGGLTVVPGANWAAYIGNSFTAAPTINSYASFTGQVGTMPGGTIHNQGGASWSSVLGGIGITNAGTWQGQLTAEGKWRSIEAV